MRSHMHDIQAVADGISQWVIDTSLILLDHADRIGKVSYYNTMLLQQLLSIIIG